MPSVSIIVPCYNEKENIRKLLEAIYAQTFPRSDLEVVIADGMSTDGTRAEISTFAGSHPNLKIIVVDNLHRHIPAGLNCALKTSQGEFIVRLDAHSLPYPSPSQLLIPLGLVMPYIVILQDQPWLTLFPLELLIANYYRG
jgi:succinoglycan biosynthesis protein ExoA